jgi:hypothetical protein
MLCLGDDRTLTELLHSFDQSARDQVRAEAEMLFRHPPTLAIAGAKVASRGSNRCYLGGSRKGGR